MFIRAGITRGGAAQSRSDNVTMNDVQANSNNVGLSLVASMDTADLRDLGEQCGINRVHRLMQRAGLRAQVGYRKPRAPSGEQHVVTPNRLER